MRIYIAQNNTRTVFFVSWMLLAAVAHTIIARKDSDAHVFCTSTACRL